MRPISACSACRNRRKRCKRPRQGTRCYFCAKRGLSCTVEDTPPPTNVERLETCEPYGILYDCQYGDGFRFSPSVFVEQDVCKQLVQLYFSYIHVAFHNLFHQPSLESAVADGTIPKILALGAMSLAARFSSHPSLADVEPRTRGRPFAREAEKLIDFRNISLTTIQACMLLAAGYVIEGRPGPESVFLGVACRMALILDLPNATATTCIEREINLRVWWSLISTDTWSSTALGIPRALKACETTPMPMDERTFMQIQPNETLESHYSIQRASLLSLGASGSLFAHMIRLNQLLYQIFTLSVQVVSESPEETAVDDSTNTLSHTLDTCYAELPNYMNFTPENLEFWARQGFGRIFVILHINYNYAGQLLFFRYLHFCQGDMDTLRTEMAHPYADRCKRHSTSLCELVHQAEESPDCDVKYPLMAHALVIASTIQLFTLLFSSDDDEVSQAKTRLKRNFETLTQLQTYWPNLDASFNKFKAFHQVCLHNKSNTFRLDQWMLRFILDYARPIGERDKEGGDGSEEAWSLTQLGY